MKGEVVSFILVFWIIVIVGFSGNLFVLIAILRSKQVRRKPSVIYILNGAVANILFIFIVGTSVFYKVIDSIGARLHQVCRVYDLYFSLNAFVMTYTVTVIALDKYLAIFKPFCYRQHSTTRIALMISTTSWLVAIVFCVPKFIIIFSKDGSRLCQSARFPRHVRQTIELTAEVIHLVMVFLIPCVVIFVVYGRLVHRLWISNHNSLGTDVALLKSRRKLSKLSLTVTVLFVLSWLPHSIETFWWCLGFPRTFVVEWFKLYASLFVLAYGAISPIIYTFYNEATLQAAKRMACCLCCKRCLNKRNIEVAPAEHGNDGQKGKVILIARPASTAYSVSGK